MVTGPYRNPRVGETISALIVIAIFLCQACSYHAGTVPYETQELAPATGSTSACIGIEGRVLGEPRPNSTISLYDTPSLNYSAVMRNIRTTDPIRWSTVNGSKGFVFECLTPGSYALVIPTSSYRGSVGSPLPYEFDCENFSLRIAFQGGDFQYAVGAFSIEEAKAQVNLSWPEPPLSYSDRKRGLYQSCAHDDR